MLRYKGQERNVTTFTCWRLWKRHRQQDSNSTLTSASLGNSRLSTLDASSLHKVPSYVQKKLKPSKRLLRQPICKSYKVCWELWTSCLHSSPIWPRRPIPGVYCWISAAILFGPVICKRNWTPPRTTLPLQWNLSTMTQTSHHRDWCLFEKYRCSPDPRR